VADIPASTSTTATISVGGSANDQVDVFGDHDWYRISLTAGQQITISLSGSGTNPLEDPYLNLRNSAGTILTYNDDSGGTRNAKIVFTATTTGTYYIDAGAWDTSSVNPWTSTAEPNYTGVGTYTLTVQPYSPPPLWTYDQIANQLINGYWTTQQTSAHHFNVTQGGTITVNYSALTSAEQTLAIAALAEWSDIIGVTFTPVTTTDAQIMFDDSEDPSADGPVAQTDGTWSNGIISQSHVQISSSWVTSYGTSSGGGPLNSYAFQTYLHEIGHALGLGHAGNYNGTADYAADALFKNDAWSTSIMSYFSQQDNSYFANQGFSEFFAVTPMVADVLAMQQMYGLSTTTRAGDTTYGFNSNAGRDVYNASIMSNVAYTVFDSGGNDTLDYSGFSQNQTINLNPETFSNVGPGVGNVSIARGTVIENAIGGSGNDTLIGNGVANILTGNLGTDTLTGGAGGDTFRGTKAGLNGDTITDFSAGDKIVLTDASLSGFTFKVSGSTLTYSGGSLTLGSALSGTLVATAAAGGGVQLAFAGNQTLQHDAANDFNGDGRSDILWRHDNGSLTDWLGTAAGGYTPNSANLLTMLATDWKVVGTGDFNGDGRDDILLRNTDGRVTDWLGTANGGLADNAANGYNSVSTDWLVAGVGDFNGDGRDDILWRNSSGTLTDWLGTASGGYAPNAANALSTVATDWKIVATGDFNGDGRDDIMWRNADGRITNWLGTASGGFSDNVANAYNNVTLDWHVAGVGDFNGDGRDDILWRNSDGRVTDWLSTANGGYAPNSAHFYDSLPNSWQVAEVGDYNGDGLDDILWRNTDGRITDWLGQSDGSFHDNAANGLTSVATAWHPQPTHDLFF
jgi:hypothetical protein